MAEYRKDGFDGLKPKPKGRKPLPNTIPIEVLEEAILLRREVPKRSVRQIIQILESDEKVTPGTIKRSTLQARLTRRGYSSRQMRLYAGGGTAARRFQKQSRNLLWQSDIKLGPYLRRSKSICCYSWMTRRGMYCMGPSTTHWRKLVEDSFRRVTEKYGVPEAVYFDNGKQYRTTSTNRLYNNFRVYFNCTKACEPYSNQYILWSRRRLLK